MSRARLAAIGLSLSAAAFVGLLSDEGFTERAVVPVQGDVPTVGFGSTKREDGSPVRAGDTITPVRAVQRASAHIGADEQRFRDSLPGIELHQAEYDLYVDWVYQYGIGRWRHSSMRRHLLDRQYKSACDALLDYRYMTSLTPIPGWEPYQFDGAGRPTRWRFDCSTPGNRVCRGVWTRQQERHARCLAAQ